MKKISFRRIMLFAVPFLSLMGCEIGLGESVDTEPPKVSVTAPSADYIIRDKFTMSGTWSDDGALSGIGIVLKNSSTHDVYPAEGSFSATVNEDKTWTCEINPLAGERIPDGSYEATVTATDTYNHITTATRSFSIDNTPPLLSLTRPSTKTGSGSVDSYGQDFSITGSAADSSDVDSIEVRIYSADDNQLKKTVVLNNVPPTIDLSVAKWGDGSYEEIYGNDKNGGTKNFWCEIVAYDSARRLPAQDGDRGNCAEYFYLNNDIYSSVIQSVKLTNAYYILNGTYSVTDQNRDTVESVKKELADSSKQIRKAVFSLNPLNNPTYELSGYKGLDDLKKIEGASAEKGWLNDSSCELMNNTKQTVNISAGLDQVPLNSDTLGIYLVECDRNGIPVESAQKITLLAPWKDKDGKTVTELSDEEKAARSAKITPVGSYAYKTVVTIGNTVSSELKSGKYYIVDVVCYDQNGNEVDNVGNEYAFRLVATAAAPVVKIDGDKSFYTNREFTVEGTATVSQDDLEIELFAYIDSAENNEPFATSGDGTIAFDRTSGKFSLNVQERVFTGKSSFSVIVQAGIKSLDGNRGTDQVQVNFDGTPPEVGELSVVPVNEDGESVNGTVTVKSNVTDNGIISKVWYTLTPEGGTESERKAVDNISSAGFQVDTTELSDKKKLTVTVYSTDIAGNEGKNTRTIKVDQSSDSPVLELSNADYSIDSVAGIKDSNKNIFGTDNNHTVLGTVSDDDGIDTVTVTYQKVDDLSVAKPEWNDSAASGQVTFSAGGSTTYSLKYDALPKTEGGYLVKIGIKDSKQETEFCDSAYGPFLVAVDNGAPKLSVNTVSGAYQAADAEITVSGTVDDASATVRLYGNEECSGEGTEVAVGTEPGADGLYSWSTKIRTGTEGDTVWFRAEDYFGQVSKQKFSYIVDIKPPTFTITSVNGEEKEFGKDSPAVTKYGKREGYFTIRGAVEDKGGSGLGESFYYKLAESEPEKNDKGAYIRDDSWLKGTITPSSGTDGSTSYAWDAPIDWTKGTFDENVRYTFYMLIEDNAGNASVAAENPSAKITIILDSVAPVIKSFKKTDPKKIELRTADDGSGISEVRFYRNGNVLVKTPAVTEETETIGEGETAVTKTWKVYTFTLENDGADKSGWDVQEGENRFKADITDSAGNSVTTPEITINNSAPLLSVETDADSNSKSRNGFLYSNRDIKISVTVKDGNRLNSLTWKDGDGTENSVQIEQNDGEQKPEVIITKPDADSAEITRTFTAKNVYGLSSTAQVKYVFDVTAPVFRTDYKAGGTTLNSTFGVSGKQKNFTDQDFADTWFGSENLVIDGIFAESGSGISELKYELTDAENGSVSGTVAATDKGDYETFKTTISGFRDGETNRLVFWAADNAGNVSDKYEYLVKVDTARPVLEENSLSVDGKSEGIERILSNAAAPITVGGTVTDTGSGISGVVVSVGGKTFDITASLSDSEPAAAGSKKFAAVIGTDKITQSGTVYARITDNAGNVLETNLFALTVDKTPPTAKINSPTDADLDKNGIQVNGTLKLTGIAEDNYSLKGVSRLLYSTSKDADVSSWSDLKDRMGDTFAVEGAASWTASGFDTTKLADGTYYLKAEVTDEAGNTGYSEALALDVDQNSDRPVIKITSLEEAGQTVQNSIVQGTVTDDDGIAEFYYSTDSSDLGKPYGTEGSNWKPLEVSGGAWRIEFEKGSHSLLFCVEDSAGKEFVTGGNTALDRPYVALGSNAKEDSSAAIAFSVDLSAPVIDSMSYAAASSETVPAESDKVWTSDGVPSLGKNMPYLFVKVGLTEDVGMNLSESDDISVTIDGIGVEFASGGKVERTEVSSSESGTQYSYTIGALDFSEKALEGTKTVTVTAKDKSGRTSSKTFNITVDNAAPEVSLTYPAADADAVTGKVTLMGTASDTTGIRSIEWLIPDSSQLGMESKDEAQGWKSLTVAGSLFAQWKIPFESSSFDEPTDAEVMSLIHFASAKSDGDGNSTKLKYAVRKIKNEKDKYVQADVSDTEIFVPVYFWTEDIAGNTELSRHYVKVNPDGGIPTVEITSHDKDGAKNSETVNLTGTATDDEGIDKVKITKIEYTEDDIADSAALTGLNWTELTDTTVSGFVVEGKGTAEDGGIILCEGKTSWKASFDVSKISGNVSGVRVTVEAFDTNGTSSAKEKLNGKSAVCQRIILVDKGAPKRESASIVGFASEPAGVDAVPVWEKSYSAGMYFSGKKADRWYLKLVITDDASVNGISVKNSTGNALSEIDTIKSSAGIESGKGTKRYTVLVPINVSTEGKVYATVTMDDGQHTDVTENFSFNIDNTAPALYGTDGSSTETMNHSDSLRLTSLGKNVGTENVVENSDGYYTFGDELDESGSGLAYVAFYFKKAAAGTSKARVYSPMYGRDSGHDNKVELADSSAENSVYINEDGLPALVKTVTVGTDGDGKSTVTFSGLGENLNIKTPGATSFGLVKIGGAYHKIASIEGDVAVLADEVDSKYTSAEFIYAMLVDHQITEGFASDGTISNDDGDGLVEMVKQTGSKYRWTASLYSDNIPDGPAEIHVVAFDEAGNINSGYVKTSVQNNRPRLARLYLATDLNGNGKFDYYNENSAGPVLSTDSEKATANGTEYGELSFYSLLAADGKVQGNAVLSPNRCGFVASDKMLVLTEIVGGNGELKYAYTVSGDNAESSAVGITTKNADGSNLLELKSTAADLEIADKDGTAGTIAELLNEKILVDKTHTLTAEAGGISGAYHGFIIEKKTLENYESWKGDDKNYRWFGITYWDSTEETVQGESSLYALLKIPVVVNVVDDIKPEATVRPFWWNSKDDSSFVYDENGQPLGHIDLPGAVGEKPGVSGRVYIDGTASDETRLGKLYLTEPDGTEYQIAEYKEGEWITDSATWKNIKSVSVETVTEPSQKGHRVNFRVEVDMTPYGVATGKTVDVSAGDAAATANKSDGSSVQTTEEAPTPHYEMDFVPYIKSIYPAVSGSANRSRLGKFPVRAGESMIIEGMNFASGASYEVNFYKSKTDADGKTVVGDAVAAEQKTGTISTAGQITVDAPQYSRWVEVVVGGVATRNNTNVNSGCNIEEGYVAGAKNEANEIDNGFSKANKSGTNFWTDDRYISVWNVGTVFDGSINPHSGLVKKIRKEDSINSGGTVGLKKKGSEILPTGDMTDGYLGFISSDDMRVYVYEGTTQNIAMSPTSDVSLFTAPVDAVDMVVLGGLPYYVLQTNYVGNVNANCWGPGLMLAREGFAYEKGTYEGTTGLGESSLKWIIERQGSNNSATGRNSSDGYDSILYQFKNPRIAGWHTDSPPKADKTNYDSNNQREQLDYVYVSYYDSYAKCLKFAAFRSGRDVSNGKISTVNTTVNNQWGGGNAGDNELVAEIRSADGNMKTGATVVAGYDTTQNNPTKFTEKAGEWSDIVVDATGGSPIPVIVYYNETNKCLEVARGNSKFPKSKNYNAVSVTELSGADAWTKTKEIRPGNSKADFGRYVSCAIDSSGNLHVAAQNATNSTLYYLYLKKSGETYSVAKSVLLDSSSGSGLWTDIELTNPSGTNLAAIRPVVSYINSSYVGTKSGMKAAYISDGAEDDVKFDVMTAPSEWAAGNQRTSVMADVYEKSGGGKAQLAVGFNSDMFAVDFLRGEE